MTRLIALLVVLLVGGTTPAAAQDGLPTVVVLATGGTIASQYDPATGALEPALTGEEIVAAVPGLGEVANVVVEQVVNVGSKDMTPAIWVTLSGRANELLQQDHVAGVIITHGTDTLEETAYFMDLTVTSPKPVIVVGAQRAPTFFDTDGPRNLLNAVRVAVSEDAIGMGAMVVMNGQINAAREVTKTNTLNPETFQSVEFGILGTADIDAVRFYRTPNRRQTIPITQDAVLPRVEIVMQYAGADDRIIRMLLDDGVDGLVIAGVGLGHLSSKAQTAVEEARERGIPVVLASRVPTGRIVPLYAADVELVALGCILPDNLTPQKARVLLMLALASAPEGADLQEYFSR